MKRTLLLFVSCIFLSVIAYSQILNTSFETWKTDTAIWGYAPYVAIDTFPYHHPAGWTSLNAVTENRNLNRPYVFKDSTAKFGMYNIKLVSDSLTLSVQGTSLVATLPGIAINGEFPVTDLNNFISGIQGPSNVKGAGQPIPSLKKKLRAWVKFSPVVLGKDTMLIWAVLRKGSVVVAEAKLLHSSNDTGYVMVEQDFVYRNCTVPDTAVILLSSSNPDFSNLVASLTSGLQVGTTARVDSFELVDFGNGETFGPITVIDRYTTYQDSFKNIAVLANDIDCHGSIQHVSIAQAPTHGTATVQPDNTITYYADSLYIGRDTLYYNAIDSFAATKEQVIVTVLAKPPVGIADLISIPLEIYPNPTTGMVVVKIPVSMKITALLYNPLGEALLAKEIITENTSLDLSAYASGVYLLILKDEQGKVVGSKRIAIAHQ